MLPTDFYQRLNTPTAVTTTAQTIPMLSKCAFERGLTSGVGAGGVTLGVVLG